MTENKLISEINDLAKQQLDRDRFLLETARTINHLYPHYTWVGFYFLQGSRLHVGPYIGKPTPHTFIELDKGICGAAVSSEETIIVDDVNSDPRYLACSLETKSEIVIPITVHGKTIGELDIDSDRLSAFNDNEKVLLEQVAELVGTAIESCSDSNNT